MLAPMHPSDAEIAALRARAREACTRAYAPYSGFPVGAAVLTEDGAMYSGANVENASYGLAICAERSAVFAAVSAGARRIDAVAIYVPQQSPATPCGACRQVLREFGSDMLVVSLCDSARVQHQTLATLLPDAFGPEALRAANST